MSEQVEIEAEVMSSSEPKNALERNVENQQLQIELKALYADLLKAHEAEIVEVKSEI